MQIVPGPGGSLAVLSASLRHAGLITHLVPGASGWTSRTVAVRTRSASDVLLAGDGVRYAVVASRAEATAGAPAGHFLTLVDLERTAVTHEVFVGGLDDEVFSLAVVPGHPSVAYVGLWHSVAPAGLARGATGLLVAVRLDTGAIVGRVRLPGVPLQLAAATGADELGQRLYALERLPGPDEWNPGQLDQVLSWRLLALDPVTLEVERVWPLDEEPRSLVVAPDGRYAYGLVSSQRALQSALEQIDLDTGAVRQVTVLPGEGLGGPVVTAEYVFVPHPAASEVWTVDRRNGQIIRSVQVGRGSVAAVVVPGS
jgi:hypothetical protein